MKTELRERHELREAKNWVLRLCARINRLTADDPVANEAMDWLVAKDRGVKSEVARREVA